MLHHSIFELILSLSVLCTPWQVLYCNQIKSEKKEAPDPFLRHSSINTFYPLFPFNSLALQDGISIRTAPHCDIANKQSVQDNSTHGIAAANHSGYTSCKANVFAVLCKLGRSGHSGFSRPASGAGTGRFLSSVC
jgi:hypothetical protein